MRVRRSAAAAALAVVLLAAVPAGVLADGDPASDILPTLDVYTPYTPAKVPAADEKTLESYVATAKKKGVAFKVALIATPIDLGAITVLSGKPAQYARFLYAEIKSFVDGEDGTLLIVMPAGVGIAGKFATPAGLRAAAAIHPGANATPKALAAAAITAMRSVAKASGRTLPSPGGGGSNATTVIVIAAVIVVGLGGIGLIVLGRRRAVPEPDAGDDDEVDDDVDDPDDD